jgi:hypothetical protein
MSGNSVLEKKKDGHTMGSSAWCFGAKEVCAVIGKGRMEAREGFI